MPANSVTRAGMASTAVLLPNCLACRPAYLLCRPQVASVDAKRQPNLCWHGLHCCPALHRLACRSAYCQRHRSSRATCSQQYRQPDICWHRRPALHHPACRLAGCTVRHWPAWYDTIVLGVVGSSKEQSQVKLHSHAFTMLQLLVSGSLLLRPGPKKVRMWHVSCRRTLPQCQARCAY